MRSFSTASSIPIIAARIDALYAASCDRLLVFPLYPQYAAATTATVNDTVFDKLKTMRVQPALRTVPPYPKDPVYIQALADSITSHLADLDFEPEVIVASYHGLPKAYIDKGDPYQCQCMDTSDALREALTNLVLNAVDAMPAGVGGDLRHRVLDVGVDADEGISIGHGVAGDEEKCDEKPVPHVPPLAGDSMP